MTTDSPKAAKAPKRLTEQALLAKYPHMVAGSLSWDAQLNKQVCTINTIGADGQFDGNTRRIATSDLFQVRHTEEVKAALDAAKRNAKAKAKRAERRATTEAMPIGATPEERLLAQS